MSSQRTVLISALVVLLASLFIALAILPVNAAADDQKIRVLIVDGCSNHDWRLTTRSIRAILEPTGLFDVAVSTAPPTAAVARMGPMAAEVS